MNVKILDAHARMPEYAHEGDAGMDLRSTESLVLAPGERATVPTGVAMELPDGYAALVMPRSGLASKHGITVVNSPGLIDSGYRGEIKVVLLNTDAEDEFSIDEGDRIAQMVILPIPEIRLSISETLNDSSRGEGGFGSSGVR